MRTRLAVLGIGGAVALLGASCSTGKSAGGASSSRPTSPPTSTSTTVDRARQVGPRADLSQVLIGGNGPFSTSQNPSALKAAGYVEQEYLAAGTAVSYRSTGALTPDGRWTFAPATKAAYRTRVLVRRPATAAAFSGTVVVEWLNVSGGLDAEPEYSNLREELLRRGDAWVGVSAQTIGVMGGPVLVTVPAGKGLAGKGLRRIDPARYGSLHHPGDGYSFDMYTQVARALRAGAPAMGGLKPQRVLAAGDSQSAFALVTYVNGVQPLTHEFDGFFVHSRGAFGLPLVADGRSADIAGSYGGTPTIFRTDQGVPILDLQAESDVVGVLSSATAHQPDTDRFRLWEVAGTAHVDLHLLGPQIVASIDCGAPINNGPLNLVAKAAFHSLDMWVRTGTPPPSAPRLEVSTAPKPTIARDGDGIARGGIRTPPLDVPVDTLSGAAGPNGSLICLLLGSTRPLPASRLAALYPSRAAYERRYAAAAAAAIRAGHVLAADRAALMAFAAPARVKA